MQNTNTEGTMKDSLFSDVPKLKYFLMVPQRFGTTLWHNALGAPYLHRLFAGRLVCIWSHTLKSRTSHAIVGTFGFVKHQVPVCTYCRSGLTRGWCVQGYQDPYPQV